MLGHIVACCKYQPYPVGAISNVYNLPSIKLAIRYLHGAAGFPTKATCMKAIRNRNYLTWPLINVKNVSNCFPVSEETQKGHMRTQRQGVIPTKAAAQQAAPLVQCTDGRGTRLSAAQTGDSPPHKTENSE